MSSCIASLPFFGQGTNSDNSTGIAQRARHPDELKQEDGKWMIDIDYYLSQQVFPLIYSLFQMDYDHLYSTFCVFLMS